MTAAARIARAMDYTAKVDYLHARGWTRIAGRQPEAWRSPVKGDDTAWTLDAAMNAALLADGAES